MKDKNKLLLILIIVIASILRLWGLGSTPPSPDWDEAALGYNAYSIIQTGRDEYGKFLPFVLQSFDDYKPALYMYLTIPAIMLFDVNVFAVRLPSAIFGILTVLATYFILRELFSVKSKTDAQSSKQAENSSVNYSRYSLKIVEDPGGRKWKLEIPIIATALLAISPWHIQFSRIAFETNVGLAFNVFAILFFLKGLKSPKFLLFSTMFMGLNLYVYQSEKVFTPLLAIVLISVFFKKLLVLPKKFLIAAFLVGFIIALPMGYNMIFDKHGLERAKGVSIFSELTPMLRNSQIKYLEDQDSEFILGKIFHNRRIVYVREMGSGYMSHFNFNWLFIRGDLMRHHPPEMGMLYLWELPFLLIGFYALLFSPFPKHAKLFIFLWFLITPIPASVTTGVPHAVRTLNFLPTFQVFTAIGLITAFQFIQRYRGLGFRYGGVKIVLYSLFLLFASFNFIYYLNQYFVQQNYFSSKDWQYGHKQAVDEVKRIEQNYDKVVVSNQPPLDQSHMFFLFYLKYPPIDYQKAGNTTSGFREIHKYGKFEFRPIHWQKEELNPNTLYIGRPEDFPNTQNKIIKQIDYLNGKPAIIFVQG